MSYLDVMVGALDILAAVAATASVGFVAMQIAKGAGLLVLKIAAIIALGLLLSAAFWLTIDTASPPRQMCAVRSLSTTCGGAQGRRHTEFRQPYRRNLPVIGGVSTPRAVLRALAGLGATRPASFLGHA